MNVRVLAVLGLTAVVVAVLAVRGCKDEEKARVEQSLAAMVAAVEAHDPAALAPWVAADYSDRLGHDDRSVVRRVMDEVEHIPQLRVELAHLSISVEKDTGYATAQFVPELGGEVDPSLKTRPKYRFEKGQRVRLRLRKHGDRYLVVRGDMGFSLTGALE